MIIVEKKKKRVKILNRKSTNFPVTSFVVKSFCTILIENINYYDKNKIITVRHDTDQQVLERPERYHFNDKRT